MSSILCHFFCNTLYLSFRTFYPVVYVQYTPTPFSPKSLTNENYPYEFNFMNKLITDHYGMLPSLTTKTSKRERGGWVRTVHCAGTILPRKTKSQGVGWGGGMACCRVLFLYKTLNIKQKFHLRTIIYISSLTACSPNIKSHVKTLSSERIYVQNLM